MVEKIKNGYNLFIKKNDEELVGTLTLKDEDIYKDIIELNDNDMKFIDNFSNIESLISNDKALSISYDNEKSRFMSSIKEKAFIGEYNDEIIWNDILTNKGVDIFESLNNLSANIEKEKEMNYVL